MKTIIERSVLMVSWKHEPDTGEQLLNGSKWNGFLKWFMVWYEAGSRFSGGESSSVYIGELISMLRVSC